MAFDQLTRLATLHERAGTYLQVALTNIVREYPHMPQFVSTRPGDERTHREFHPAFFGCFDWHSCVEMHWVIVRLLRACPEVVAGERARSVLDGLLTEDHLAREVEFFSRPQHRSIERPYGWGWLLRLQHDLMTWNDPDARRWASAVAPLANLFSQRLLEWLPGLTYPQRTGVHPNTAFGLSCCYDFASLRASAGDAALLTAIQAVALDWFGQDMDYPVNYEPSGADFLSAGLCEAELMSRVLEPRDFSSWLERFLPGLAAREPASLFTPARVSDPTDGQGAHLHGLNLSRAWAFTALVAHLPADDARVAPLLEAAEAHAQSSLAHVSGSDYMVEHWLAAYATLLLSQ